MARMKVVGKSQLLVRKTISMSAVTLSMAQHNADKYFGGNLSAYLSSLVIQGDYCNRCALDNSLKIDKLKVPAKDPQIAP